MQSLTLTNVQAPAAGRYLVEVSNQSGQRVRSEAANLEVGPDDLFVCLVDGPSTPGPSTLGPDRVH